MGPTGLTAVFGMGTGVSPPVWSPESRPSGRQADPGEAIAVLRSRRPWSKPRRPGASLCRKSNLKIVALWHSQVSHDDRDASGLEARETVNGVPDNWETCVSTAEPATIFTDDGSGWSSDRLLELVRCGGRPPYTPSPSTWSSSRSLHSYC